MKTTIKIALDILFLAAAFLLLSGHFFTNPIWRNVLAVGFIYTAFILPWQYNMQKKILQISAKTLVIFFSLIVLLWLLLQTETIQNFIVNNATARLSRDLHTEVSIGHVSFSFFDKMNLDRTLVKDKQQDTLLYAASLKVRITDWFIFKDTAEISYIGLENAVIKLQRSDSVWNDQFLLDFFSSSKPKQKDTTPGLQLDLKKIDLKNVTFIQNDRWHGQRITAKVGSLLLDANKIDLNKSILDINEINIDKPYFSIDNFNDLDTSKRAENHAGKDSGLYFNQGSLFVKAASIKITNGIFTTKDDSDKHPNDYFDGSNMVFSKLNATFNNFSFIKDTIRAQINLSAKERSGFNLKKLAADFKLTPQIMEFAKLELRTDKSKLGDYYAMHFKDFNHDINYYVEKIEMDAHFKNSLVNSDDIAFFAPDLKAWKKQVMLTGKFLGTVADFKITDMFLRSGNDMYMAGSLAMKGLPDINKTTINFSNGIFQGSYADMITIAPLMKTITSPDLSALGKVRFTGNYSGNIHDFIVNGNISTAIGGVFTNMSMKLPLKGEPSYKGSVITEQFDLGKFLHAPSIGLVSFNGKVDGSSFSLTNLKTTLDGSFSKFQFNNYTYTNLDFKGTLANKYFTGAFKASDPNFDFTSNMVVDLRGKEPKFNLLGDLAKANFRALNFTRDSVRLTGLFDLDFQGKNIDEFTGDAKILNAVLIHDTSQLNFDSLTVNSYFNTENKKILNIQSNQFNINVNGQYSILDLPNSFQYFLSHYFPAYIHPPKTMPVNQNFTVDIKTLDFTKYAQVLDSRVSGLDSTEISGSVNTNDSGSFYFSVNVPEVKFENYKLENGFLNGAGNFKTLSLKGNIDKVYIGDSTYFPNTILNIHSSDDHSSVSISTSANNTLNDAELNAEIYTLPGGVKIDFDPSSFVINQKKWDLEKEGELIITKSYTSAKNVKFSQGFQEITVETQSEASSKNNLVVHVKDLNMGDFMPLITKNPRIEGLANGSVYMRDFYGPFTITTDINATQFRLDDDSVGVVSAKAVYDSKTGYVTGNILSDNEKYNFSADVFYNTKDSVKKPLNTTFHLNGTKVTIVNEFLNTIFSNVTGEAFGDLTIKGDFSTPDLIGRIKLRNAGLLVNYTKVHYNIDSADFNFSEGKMDFGEFNMHDDFGRTAVVRGKLYEKEFSNFVYDFDMSTEKLLLLNTTAKDNQQFYGRAIGAATMSLKGPQENLQMNLKGSSNDTSHIYIPTTNSRESADADFIIYKKYGTELKDTSNLSNNNTNLTINLDLTATNDAQIDVILDELTGDVIKATGSGRLLITVPAKGNMTMNGRYNIDRGSYDFNFQSIIRKPFELLEGQGNFIEWNGDPSKANIHVSAQYTAERIGLSDLISNQSTTLNGAVKGYRGDVYVIADLTGNLEKPDIKFRLDFPLGSPVKTDNEFNLFLARIESDNNEMLKQVTYLIVLGSFAPYGELTGSANATSLSVNTISQRITSELNKIFSNVLFKLTGDKSLQFDVAASTYSSATLLETGASANSKLDRQTVNLKVNKSILNNKVIFTVGGDLDFGLNNSYVQSGNFQWLPDISVQIILSLDRKLRAIIFNKSSLDVNTATLAIGRTTRQGVSISYTKDFEKLFGKKEKNKSLPIKDSTQKLN